MLRFTLQSLCAWTIVLSLAVTAQAQWFSSPCGCRRQPVLQTCYRQVPVTQYRQVRRTVKKPVIERKYVDQKYTAYRQVVEKKTVEIPTVSYQNVTEYRSREINSGRWMTRHVANPKCTPCQYNNRPGLLADLDRLGYAIRSSFVPNYTTVRQYVPQVTVQTFPVTRQVAIHGTRKVTRNVAKMVPYTATRKVAVDRVKYVEQEVVAMEPYTVVRTVPIGPASTFASAPVIIRSSRTALRPSPDPVSAESDGKKKSRNANSFNNKYEKDPARSSDRRSDDRGRSNTETSELGDGEISISAIPTWTARAKTTKPKSAKPVPSIVRVSGWRARVPSKSDIRGKSIDGPILQAPSLVAARP